MDIFKLVWPNLPEIEGIEIDLARLEDAGAIGLLSRRFIETGMEGWAWNPQKIVRAIRDPDSLVVVARDRKIAIAAADIQFRDQQANLNLLVVAEIHQGNGIGSCLLRFMENMASLNNCSSLSLEVRATSSSALAFYKSRGYRQIEVVSSYYHNGEDAIRMSRTVNNRPSSRIETSN